MKRILPETLTVDTVSDIFTLDQVSYNLLWKVSPSYKIKEGLPQGKWSQQRRELITGASAIKGKITLPIELYG